MIKLPAFEPILKYATSTHEDWLSMRNTGLGGSDAGGVLNMSLYSSPLSIWMDKTGRAAPDDLSDNEFIKVGNILEPLIRSYILPEYLEEKGYDVEVIAPTHMYRSIENPFMIINTDGFLRVSFDCPECENVGILLDGDDCGKCNGTGRIVILAGLEIKTGNSYQLVKWGGKDGDEIPDPYYCQVQHYMAGTGLDEFWVFGLIGNQRLLRIVPRNNEFIARLIEAERSLWEKVVLNDVLFAPMPSGSDADMEALFQLGSPQEETTVDLSDVQVSCDRIYDCNREIGELETIKKLEQQRIIMAMGISKYGESPNGYKVTFSRFDRSSFDKNKFERDNPGMMDKYMSYNESGRLSIKSI